MFCIPAKFDFKFIKKLEENDRYRYVSEVYFAEPKTLVGHGRPSNKIKLKIGLKDFVEYLNTMDLELNYLLNASCCGNLEYDAEWRKEFIDFVEYLTKIGVESFTVAIPYLLELIKSEFDVKVVVSVIARVNNVRMAEFWQKLGADAIFLDNSVNRNFKVLKAIREAVNIELGLIVNECCLLHCPMKSYHFNIVSHSSQLNSRDYVNYPIYRCTLTILNDIAEYIKSPWIRPEDLKYYDCVDRFKIVGREKSVEFVFRCLDAYVKGSWSGNLLDIIPTMIKLPIYIDNTKLNGFLKWFLDGKCDENCSSCGYCSRVAREVISYDESELRLYKDKLEKLLKGSLSC